MTATPGDIWRSKCGTIELRLGRWQEVLADVERCDAIICDPPYSERTHSAYREMPSVGRRAITYEPFTREKIDETVAAWSELARGWIVALTDDVLVPDWRAAFEAAGRYAFAPLACVEPGSRVRISGDGPSQWSVFAMVARPSTREFQRWGALVGAYVLGYSETRRGAHEGKGLIGSKPLSLMRSIVCDYTRPGDLIVDPFAGSGTTLLAAAIEGRQVIGAEMDPETFDLAVRRLERGWTPAMRFDVGREMKQGGLL